MKGADAIVAGLAAAGVDRVFGVAGESVIDLMDAVREADGVGYHALRHEGAAALAASGNARRRRGPSACLGHVGAGVTNLVNGVADAYKDSVPVAVIAGDVETAVHGRDAWHEIDQTGLFGPVTDWGIRLDRVDRLPTDLREAMTRLTTGTPGPILIDVPQDVARSDLPGEVETAVRDALETIPAFGEPSRRIEPANAIVPEVIDRLVDADRPTLLAGGGVGWARAEDSLAEFVEVTGIPVITTLTGRGVFPETHPRCFGALGTFGRGSARMIADDADLVLAVGTELGDNETFRWSAFEDASIVHSDIDSDTIGRQFDVEVGIQADAGALLEALTAEATDRGIPGVDDGWTDGAREALDQQLDAVRSPDATVDEEANPGRVSPYRILEAVSSVRNPGETITSGAGQHSLWANLLPVEAPATVLKSVGFGTMGFAFSAGIGAAVADGGPSFVLVGDGDFAMVSQELWSSVEQGVDVVIIVFDDRQLSAIKTPQEDRFGRTIGVDHEPVDLAAVAEAYGAKGIRVGPGDDLIATLERARTVEGPVLVDVPVDADVDPPSFFYEYQ